MKRTVLILIVILIGLTVQIGSGHPVMQYMYFTDFERTIFNQFVWFWSPDTMYGVVRSNDYIPIKFSPHFYGQVITSQDHFIEYQASPHFEHEPIFNAPRLELPESYPHIIEMADWRIEPRRGENASFLMYWIEMGGGNRVNIFAYPRGEPRNDSLIMSFWLNPFDRGILYVDGYCEVEGVLRGILTIYCTQDIYLIDNVLYAGANRRTGWFDSREGGMRHMLGLVAENDIIIKNTWENGRENGYNVARGDQNRHSIIINAGLISLGGSFTFEHQNEDWDLYQGPVPDERGYIYLVGSIAQRRKGFLHSSNHQGTGYGKAFNYDFRFQRNGPPGFGPGEYPIVEGRYQDLALHPGREYTIRNATVDNLTVYSGAKLRLDGARALTATGGIEFIGEENYPIEIEVINGRSVIRFDRGASGGCRLNHVNFGRGVMLESNADSLLISHCLLVESADLTGYVEADSNWFKGRLTAASWSDLYLTRSVFEEGMVVSGAVRNGMIANNTIAGANRAGILIRSFRNLTLKNNIITANRDGIVNHHYEEPTLSYNCVWNNGGDDYVDCAPGEGSISEDPRLIDSREDRLHLRPDSPCIDAGDPASPRDPDSSRADMGAFYRSHGLEVTDDEEQLPGELKVTASPNPFNSVVVVECYNDVMAAARLTLFDLKGRKIFDERFKIRIELNGNVFGTAGIYFAIVESDGQRQKVKLVYLP